MSTWIAQLPSGRFALLQEQSGLPGWHKELGTFASEKEARAFAKAKFIVVAGGGGRRPPGRPPVDSFAYQTLGKQILAKLDELYAANPSGITAQMVMAHFKCTYELALAALRWLGGTGQAQWVYSGGETRKFLFPNGVGVQPRARLGLRAQKVLAVLAGAADADGIVSMGYREIARLTGGFPSNSVSALITVLRLKGYLDLLESGGRSNTSKRYNVPSKYRVRLTPEPTERPAVAPLFAGHHASQATSAHEALNELRDAAPCGRKKEVDA